VAINQEHADHGGEVGHPHPHVPKGHAIKHVVIVRSVFVGIWSNPAPQDGVVKEIEGKGKSRNRCDNGKAQAQNVHAQFGPLQAFALHAKPDDEQIVNAQASVVDVASHYNLLDKSLSGARSSVARGSDDVRLSEK